MTSRPATTVPLPSVTCDIVLPAGTTGGHGAPFATLGDLGQVDLKLPIQSVVGWRTYLFRLQMIADDRTPAASRYKN